MGGASAETKHSRVGVHAGAVAGATWAPLHRAIEKTTRLGLEAQWWVEIERNQSVLGRSETKTSGAPT